jgi:hypothetical protein
MQRLAAQRGRTGIRRDAEARLLAAIRSFALGGGRT